MSAVTDLATARKALLDRLGKAKVDAEIAADNAALDVSTAERQRELAESTAVRHAFHDGDRWVIPDCHMDACTRRAHEEQAAMDALAAADAALYAAHDAWMEAVR